jgi:hypothetical protein
VGRLQLLLPPTASNAFIKVADLLPSDVLNHAKQEQKTSSGDSGHIDVTDSRSNNTECCCLHHHARCNWQQQQQQAE